MLASGRVFELKGSSGFDCRSGGPESLCCNAADSRIPSSKVCRNSAGEELHVGHAGLSLRRAGMEVVPTIRDGLYGDLDQLEALWDHAIRHINPPTCGCILTLPPVAACRPSHQWLLVHIGHQLLTVLNHTAASTLRASMICMKHGV